MAKKRRHVTQRAANCETVVDNEAIEESLEKLGTYYNKVSAEVMEIPTTLEFYLLLHTFVALFVQNSLLAVQTVSIAQIVMVVGSALSMTRKRFVTMLLPPVALRGNNSREVLWRSAIFLLVFSGLGLVYFWWEISISTPQFVAFVVVFLLDAVSIDLVRRSKGRLTRRQIAVSAIEVTFLVFGFSICFHYQKRGIIYDEMALVLTAATAFVHVVVLLTAEYAVLHCFTSDNGAFSKTQQRGANLMESIRQDMDRFQPEQLLVGLPGSSKKKKGKSKSRTSPSQTVRTDSECKLDPTASTRSSVFKEPRVQFALLTLIQILLLVSQLVLSAFVLYSWEMMSALMFSSSHVLWTLGQVRRKVLSRSTITSAGQKLKNA
ncbi:putative Fluconazole resistance protein 1 [Phytophthora palmivora]|uniref:Fluconazole resistance protein 1 n=1 Tax=Phytophthora palmivora TaxID=4796 RepID=A0A2P4XDZ5_9STRA|nr:putative Fluconazole resistance protein 1 [Phytophthora palmivora]